MGADPSSILAARAPGVIPRRPALPAVICLIAGICFAYHLPISPWMLLAITAITMLAALLLQDRTVVASVLIAIALISLGAVIAQAELYRYPANDIGSFSSTEPRLAQLELRIDDPPRLRSSKAGGRMLPPKQIMVAAVQRILTKNGWISASGNILLQISHEHPLLAAGQTIRVLGMLERPARATNPGEFDSADYYRYGQQRILTSIQISRVENIHILGDPGPGIIGWLRSATRDLLAMGFTDSQATDHAVLRSMVLGDSDPMMRSDKEDFEKLGISYLITARGTQIALVTSLVYGICRLLLRSPRFASWACMMIVILYGIVALPNWSVFRTEMICCAFVVGNLFRRRADKLQLLAIVAGVVLTTDPTNLFNAQFQLGFSCILGLILLGRPLVTWFVYRDQNKEGILLPITTTLRWQIWSMFRAWMIISIVIWAVSLPLVAHYFGQISPWSVPAAIVFLPMVTVASWAGIAKISLSLAWPGLSGLWARVAVEPIVAIRHSAVLFAHLPVTAIPAAQPDTAFIVIYYALLCLPLLPWPKPFWRRAASGLAVAAVCSMLASLSLGFTTIPLAKQESGASITFLDIGAGQCCVLHAPNAAPMMIDAGSSTVSDVVHSCLGPYLSQRGDRTIGKVFLSHSDFDHISAISGALPTFGVETVYTSHYFARFASIDPPAQSLLDLLVKVGKSPHLLQRGDHVQLTSEVAIDVLWPPSNCGFNCNNTGLVLKLSYGGRTVLFPADIQVDAMHELLKSPGQLKADILIAAHHGSSEITTPAFVKAVDPRLIISSNGSPLTQKQQLFEKMIGKRPLYRTSNCGAITLHIDPHGGISVETFLPQRLLASGSIPAAK